MANLIKCFLIVSLGSTCISAADAATIPVGPSDCSAAAVNSAISSAIDGDTVELTCTGTVTWTSTVSIPNTKGITLKGPGTNTPKASAKFPLVVSSNLAAITINVSAAKELYRVTGFEFRGSGTGTYISINGAGTGKTGLGAFRIDNNLFYNLRAQPVIWNRASQGALYGLIDNNTFRDNGIDNYTIAFWEFFQPPGNTCWGKDSWIRPFAYGSGDFNFVEDNLFEQSTVYQRHYVEHEMGGRSVIRYNTFTPTVAGVPDIIDAHGECLCNTNGAGTRGGEIYGNTFQGSSSSVGRPLNIRGGHWLVYDNTFTTPGYAGVINFTEYRASTIDCAQCSTRTSCTTQPTCVTNSPSYHPAAGQIQNTYIWNNVLSGANRCPLVRTDNYVPFYIQSGRDYFCSAAKPTALASYTPYTYPHPLRNIPSVAPSPPTTLQVR